MSGRWSMGAAILGVFLVFGGYDQPSSSKPPQKIFHLPGPLPRLQRADFLPPDAVVFAFESKWLDELAGMLSISAAETKIELLVDPLMNTEDEVRAWLSSIAVPAEEVHLVPAVMDSPWVRDYGPLQVFEHDRVVWLDPFYGTARPHDDAVPAALAASLHAELEVLPTRFDGGALISDGRGFCASTSDYFSENAIDLDDEAERDALFRQLGCETMVLVPSLIEERTRHVDMIAQFLSEGVLAVAEVDPAESPEDAVRMDEAAALLSSAAAQRGIALRVVRVPLFYRGLGEYRTYLNGLKLRSSYLVPSYDDVPRRAEARAQAILSDALAGVAVVPISADKMIDRLGALHCISLGLSLR